MCFGLIEFVAYFDYWGTNYEAPILVLFIFWRLGLFLAVVGAQAIPSHSAAGIRISVVSMGRYGAATNPFNEGTNALLIIRTTLNIFQLWEFLSIIS